MSLLLSCSDARRQDIVEELNVNLLDEAFEAYEYFVSRRMSTTESDAGSEASFVTSSSSLVDIVRQELLRAVDSVPDQVDDCDVERLMAEDALVEKFVDMKLQELEREGEEAIVGASVSYLMSWLKWRKSYGVNDMAVGDFPTEAWDSEIATLYLNSDRRRENVAYVNLARYKMMGKDISSLIVRFIICATEEVVTRHRPEQQFRIVLDTSGLGFTNADLSLALELAPMWLTYYPGIIKSFDLIDVNFMVKAAMSVVVKILSPSQRKLIHFVSKKSLLADLGQEGVPRFLGGSGGQVTPLAVLCRDYECPSIEEVGARLGYGVDMVKKFKRMLINSKSK